METRNKRRVAHRNKDEFNPVKDIVSDIMKQMNTNLANSGNKDLCKISKTQEIVSTQSKISKTSIIPTKPIITSSQKKFLTSKRHPLMEKVQKNIKFIKHNRKMPKPRAHLGGLRNVVESEKLEINKAQKSSTQSRCTKPKCVTDKNKLQKNDFQNNISSDEYSSDVSSKRTEVPNLTSDSESEYERFIQTQKVENDERGGGKKSKRKKKTKHDVLKKQKTSVSIKKANAKVATSEPLGLKNIDSEKTHNKNRKHKRSKISSKITDTNKRMLPDTSDSTTISSDEDELLETDIYSEKTHNKNQKHKRSKISSKITDTNKRMLPDTSASKVHTTISSDDELLETETAITSVERESNDRTEMSKSNDRIEMSKSNNRIELSKSNDRTKVSKTNDKTKGLKNNERIEASLRCMVRIERNPYLEETVSQLDSLSQPNVNNNESISKETVNQLKSSLQDKKKDSVDKFEDEIVLDSDDDCMIVCEVPNPDTSLVNTSVVESGSDKPDIQILNVVSLTECKDTNANFEDKISSILSSSCNEDSVKINFERLKEAIEIAEVQKLNTNPSIAEANMTSILNTVKEPEVSCMKEDIIESVNNIDVKQILSLISDTNIKFNNPPLFEEKAPLPCSSSFIDEQPSFTCLSSNSSEVIPEDHWQNLRKAVSIKNDLHKGNHGTSELFDGQSRNINFTNNKNVNSVNNIVTPTVKPDINSSTLKDILSTAYQQTGSNVKNTIQDTSVINQVKKNVFEDSSDKFDALTTEKIQEMCNLNSENILKLLNMFSRTNQELIDLKNRENITLGLKMLQEIEANRKKQTEIVLKHVMKHDPCFYTSARNQVDNVTNKKNSIQVPKIEGINLSKHSKMCANCGIGASIACTRCMEVYFCSEKCGVYYWENIHYKECIGLQQ